MPEAGQRICRLAEEAAKAGNAPAALQLLRRLRDELEDFERQQVARALTDGCSFGEVARAMGVSRQAVHRRFRSLAPPAADGDGRIAPTPEARLAVEYARQEAHELGATRVTGAHLLLGVLRAGDRSAAPALGDAGITSDTAREATRKLSAAGTSIRATLGAAVREARLRGDRRLGPEHLVLGLLAEPSDDVVGLLEALGVEPATLRAALARPPSRAVKASASA